jgi:hypothetical protein
MRLHHFHVTPYQPRNHATFRVISSNQHDPGNTVRKIALGLVQYPELRPRTELVWQFFLPL